MQLLRLHDASNFSHGRTSASTFDDGFSPAADESETDDSDVDVDQHRESSPLLPPGMVRRRHKKLDEILPSYETSEVDSDDPGFGAVENDTVDNAHFTAPVYDEATAPPRAKRAKTTNRSTSRKASTARSNARSRAGSKSVANSRKGSKAVNAQNVPATASSTAPSAANTTPVSTAATSVAPSASSNGHVFAVPPLPQQMISPVTAARKLSTASSISSNAANLAAIPNYHAANKPLQPQSVAGGAVPTLTPEEEDLSTKPRCQRCRKSKKGCDRQRPCQRCKDAGIGIEGCVSEDEGNGRKGRYGRHMGVPVKKAVQAAANGENILAVVAGTSAANAEKKKRKR